MGAKIRIGAWGGAAVAGLALVACCVVLWIKGQSGPCTLMEFGVGEARRRIAVETGELLLDNQPELTASNARLRQVRATERDYLIEVHDLTAEFNSARRENDEARQKAILGKRLEVVEQRWSLERNVGSPVYVRKAVSMAVPEVLSLFVCALAWWRAVVAYGEIVPEGCCRRCGYNLHGTAGGICPECGAVVSRSS